MIFSSIFLFLDLDQSRFALLTAQNKSYTSYTWPWGSPSVHPLIFLFFFLPPSPFFKARLLLIGYHKQTKENTENQKAPLSLLTLHRTMFES